MKEFFTALTMLICNIAPWIFLGILIDLKLSLLAIIPLFIIGWIGVFLIGLAICQLFKFKPPSLFSD